MTAPIVALPVAPEPRPLGFTAWWREYDACRARAGMRPSSAGDAARHFIAGRTPAEAVANP